MTKRTRTAFLALVLVIAAPAVHAADTAAASNVPRNYFSVLQAEIDVRQALDQWMAAIGTGSSDAVMNLYAKDAVLLPTFSGRVCDTPELRKQYFDEFTAKTNLKGKIVESHLHVFGFTAVNSGLYTFTYTKNGETVEIPARFTFVYHKYPQGWLIMAHHSSIMPTP